MICGIDPGLSGGIAFLGHNYLEVLPMPISTLVIANKKRRGANSQLKNKRGETYNQKRKRK
jgi:hypothetical protein